MADRAALKVTILTGLGILLLLPLLPFLMEMAKLAGRYIPQEDIGADYALALAWAAVLGISIGFWPVPTAHRHALYRLWAVKCAVTLGVMLFTEWWYEMDAYDYFRMAR